MQNEKQLKTIVKRLMKEVLTEQNEAKLKKIQAKEKQLKLKDLERSFRIFNQQGGLKAHFLDLLEWTLNGMPKNDEFDEHYDMVSRFDKEKAKKYLEKRNELHNLIDTFFEKM